MSENRMICDNHLDIQMDADKIVKLINQIENYIITMDVEPEDIDYIYSVLDQIHIAAVHAKSCAKNAMRQGQRMEKRLKKYHDSIVRLGFYRKTKPEMVANEESNRNWLNEVSEI